MAKTRDTLPTFGYSERPERPTLCKNRKGLIG
jgi:hypothetical protein